MWPQKGRNHLTLLEARLRGKLQRQGLFFSAQIVVTTPLYAQRGTTLTDYETAEA